MASSFLITFPVTLSPRRPTSSQKPPPRFSVSCNRKESSRRDMLLGMGGLYGAANLIATNSPAAAEPIPAPTLDKCYPATDLNDEAPVAFPCCPPHSETSPTQYVLPPVSKLRVRPALHLAGPDYFKKYERAVKAMKEFGEKYPDDPRGYKQQAHVHCAYCNLAYPQTPDSTLKLQIHFSWHFLPWHRWYLYFYERILASFSDDPSTFALPFWNWDNPSGMTIPDVFRIRNTPLYDEHRDQRHYAPAITDLRYDGERLPGRKGKMIRDNLSEMYSEMIRNGSTPTGFYGGKYVVGTNPTDATSLQGSIEAGSHTALHAWTGENTTKGFDMGNFSTAGNDQLFFCHHANIDRLWTVWRGIQEKNNRPSYFKDDDWLKAEYVFYDENAKPVIVNVKDTLDNEAMGFTWQYVENQWEDCKPRALVKKSQFAQTSKAPKSSDAKFPVKLDNVFRVLVDRPRKKRDGKEKVAERELLEISDINVDNPVFVRFEVFLNDEDMEHEDLISTAQYAGCYSQIPMSHGLIKGNLRLDLTELLEELDVEDDDKILVSIVPKAGGESITVGGIKIVFDS